MPRGNRQISYTKVYHIILRGIDKQDIFIEEVDYHKFLNLIQEEKTKYNYDIYAYCLMNNHIHMVIYDRDKQLSKIIQSIGIRYSMYFNKKYDRVGHLFQDRFLSKNVEDKEYLVQLCKYIHRNPLKARISKIDNYQWSSYQEYIGQEKIIDTKMLLSILSNDIKDAKKEFEKMHLNNVTKEEYYQMLEFEINNKIGDSELIEYICKFLNKEYLDIKKILETNNIQKNKILVECKKIKGITNRQLARIFGINRKVVDRAK